MDTSMDSPLSSICTHLRLPAFNVFYVLLAEDGQRADKKTSVIHTVYILSYKPVGGVRGRRALQAMAVPSVKSIKDLTLPIYTCWYIAM